MSSPEISIIIPVYNAENYLHHCLDSVIQQSFENWECILINDGSTDKSGDICEEFIIKDKRFRLVNKKNEGVTAARRDGVFESKASWITFIDADDWIYPHALEALWKNRDENDIITAGITDSTGRKWINKRKEEMHGSEFLKSLRDGTTYAYPIATLYNKQVFKESSFFPSPDIKIGEDVLMKLELAKRVSRAKNIDDIIYYYEYNPNSAMHRYQRSILYHIRYDKLSYSITPDEYPLSSNPHLMSRYIASVYDNFLPMSEKYRLALLAASMEYNTSHLSFRERLLLLTARSKWLFHSYGIYKDIKYFLYRHIRRDIKIIALD